MSNSKTVKERVSRDYECVTCGWSEFDIRETTAVAEGQDESLVGEQYEECRNCGETYAGVGGRSDHLSREPRSTISGRRRLHSHDDRQPRGTPYTSMSDSGTESGVCYGKSPLTGNWYRVTEWEDRGDGKIVAEAKEQVDKSEVPDEWVEATEEKLAEVVGDAE